MSKIIQLKAENVKRLKAVEINPDGNVVVIAGENGQGKTSVIDSIMYALAGAKSLPKVPVRKGEQKASVELDLGDIIVKRTFTESGGTSLVVTNKAGLKYPSPQAILDAMVGRLSFDPLEFARQEPSIQAATLRKLAGLDVSEIDRERIKHYDARTLVGREVKSLEARIAALPQPVAGLPEEEVSAASILEEQQKASAVNSENAKLRVALVERTRAADASASAVTKQEETIERLKRELKAAENTLAELEKFKANAIKGYMDAKTSVEALTDIDLSPFADKLKHVEATNRAVRGQAERKKFAAELKLKTAEQDALTTKIEDADKRKREAVAAVKYPVEGLSVSEDGSVQFNGLPFEQAASAEQLRVSVAIGLALNPKLRVLLIRDGSLLDNNSRKILAQMADEADAQVWLEVVSDGGETAVVIEDGMVRIRTANEEKELL